MKKKDKKENKDWRTEFENEFGGWWSHKSLLTERIEDFIESLLTQTKEDLEIEHSKELKQAVEDYREWLENEINARLTEVPTPEDLSPEKHPAYRYGYRVAVAEILSSLKNIWLREQK